MDVKKVKEVSNLKKAIIYAQALYGGAEKSGSLSSVYDEAMSLQSIVSQNVKYFAELDNPLWEIAAKQKVLDDVFKQSVLSESMHNLLKILLENRKFHLLNNVLSQFIKDYQDKHNIAEIEVITVIPLTTSQDSLLRQKLTKIFNKDVIIRYKIDAKIVGGLVIKYGTNFIDHSIKNKLTMLEQLMKGVG